MSKRQLLGDYPQLSTSDTSLRIPECRVNKYQEGVLAVTPEIETRINKQLHPQLSVQNIATRLNNTDFPCLQSSHVVESRHCQTNN